MVGGVPKTIRKRRISDARDPQVEKGRSSGYTFKLRCSQDGCLLRSFLHSRHPSFPGAHSVSVLSVFLFLIASFKGTRALTHTVSPCLPPGNALKTLSSKNSLILRCWRLGFRYVMSRRLSQCIALPCGCWALAKCGWLYKFTKGLPLPPVHPV